MLSSAVCPVLADPERLRLFGTICREADGVPVADIQLSSPVRKALGRLVGAELVQRAGDRYVVRPETFLHASRDSAGAGSADAGLAGATDRVRALFHRGRLVSMPRAGALRTELLRWLAERFERGRIYSEAEIRREVEPCYADHAALRRYLVDGGLLERDNHGSYWRPGQTPGHAPDQALDQGPD